MFSVLADSSSTSSSHQSRRSQTSMRAPKPKSTAQKRQSKKKKQRQTAQQGQSERENPSKEVPNITADQAENMGSVQDQAEETKAPELPTTSTGVEVNEEEQTVARMPQNLDLTSESAYLQSTKTTNDLMDQLMQQLNLKMPDDLSYYIRWMLHMPPEVISCLNTCLLISPSSMRDFACRSLEQSMTNLPMTAILHPHVLSTTMFAWAFGMNWQKLILSAGQEDLVDFSMITADDIIGEFRVAHDTGVRSQMERIIARRLREYHGLPLSGDAASVMSYGSMQANPVVKVTKPTVKALLW